MSLTAPYFDSEEEPFVPPSTTRGVARRATVALPVTRRATAAAAIASAFVIAVVVADANTRHLLWAAAARAHLPPAWPWAGTLGGEQGPAARPRRQGLGLSWLQEDGGGADAGGPAGGVRRPSAPSGARSTATASTTPWEVWPAHKSFVVFRDTVNVHGSRAVRSRVIGTLSQGQTVRGRETSGWLLLDDASLGSVAGGNGTAPGRRAAVGGPAWVLIDGHHLGLGPLLQKSCPVLPGAGAKEPFPEVDYLYLPERPADSRRLKQVTLEYASYVGDGGASLRIVPSVDPELWPHGGRYARVEAFGRQLPVAPRDDGAGAGGSEEEPWWKVRNLNYAQVDRHGRSSYLSYNLSHPAGCSLSHFVAWMDARSRGVRAMVIAESDGFPSRFERQSVGSTCEFGSVVQASLAEAPDDWQIIYLDKGKRGVKRGRGPVKQMWREGWHNPYQFYRYTGEGVAGAALYMVSHRFLDQVPRMIRDSGFDMVDAYLDQRCSEDRGDLKCYSVLERPAPAAKDGWETLVPRPGGGPGAALPEDPPPPPQRPPPHQRGEARVGWEAVIVQEKKAWEELVRRERQERGAPAAKVEEEWVASALRSGRPAGMPHEKQGRGSSPAKGEQGWKASWSRTMRMSVE